MITTAKISAVTANSFVVYSVFLVARNSSNKRRLTFFVSDVALIRGRRYANSKGPLQLGSRDHNFALKCYTL